MRAAALHAPGDLRVEEVPRPEAGPGGILVQVEVALTDGRELRHDFSGIVDGRRVVAPTDSVRAGALSEWLVVPEDSLLGVPNGLAPEVAALVGPLAGCLLRVERAELTAGDVVTILDVGTTALLLAACVADAGGWPVVVDAVEHASEFGAHPGDGHVDVELEPAASSPHTPATVRAALGFLASGAYPWELLITHRVLLDDLPRLFADPPAGLLTAAVVM